MDAGRAISSHLVYFGSRGQLVKGGRLTMIAWRGRVPWSPARQHRASTNIGLAWLDVSLSVLFCAPTILFSKGCTRRQLVKMHQTKQTPPAFLRRKDVHGGKIDPFFWMNVEETPPFFRAGWTSPKKRSLNALQLLTSISSTKARVDDSVPWPMMTWKSLWLQSMGIVGEGEIGGRVRSQCWTDKPWW